jgi:alpha-tubulin suppressor-like RCC1 family protein
MGFMKSAAATAGFGLLLIVASCANSGDDSQNDAGIDATPIGPCGPGTAVKCGDTCVDTQSDALNCGACGKACDPSLVCSHGACTSVCASGTIHCGSDCIDQGVDVNNCGGCGKKCPSGNVCSKGSCELTCQDGLTNCNGDCVDVTQSDDDCGACGSPCGGGQVCQDSKCIATCETGWSSCPSGDAGATTCVDEKNDPQNCNGCGTACPSGQFCSPKNGVGTCGLQCFGGTSLCSGACVDESIDKNHCGGCTTVCSGACSAGHCCSTGQVWCGACDTVANCITKSSGRISAGNSHTCAITSSGTLMCWGDYSSGELGDDMSNTVGTATSVLSLTNVTNVAAGFGFTCAVASGNAYCWGDPFEGEIGDGDPDTEYDAPGLTTPGPLVMTVAKPATRIAAGDEQGCALLSTGIVNCWGGNNSGELGNGAEVEKDSPVKAKITTGTAVDIGTADGFAPFSCALMSDGTVLCWGDDEFGECGDNTQSFLNNDTPMAVQNLTSALAISVGAEHACALRSDGTVWCWGDDSYDELGDGGNNNDYSTVPVQAKGVTGAVAIAAGDDFTCALLQTGSVVCWGANFTGQLGDGTENDSATPVVALSSGAVALSAGDEHACALKSDGSAWCWGSNFAGQLGDGSFTEQDSPVKVVGY